MISYVGYDVKGKVVCFGTSQKAIIATVIDNLLPLRFLEVTNLPLNPMDYYVKEGSLVEKPSMRINGNDSRRFSGLPPNTGVYLDGSLVGTCESGTLTLEKPDPLASYKLKFVNFPYLDHEVTL